MPALRPRAHAVCLFAAAPCPVQTYQSPQPPLLPDACGCLDVVALWRRCKPQAIDLLDSMLIFNPEKRCSMVDALNSEYMAALHQGRELPSEEKHFSFGFEKPDITQDELRSLIWEEMSSFHTHLQR